MRLINYHLLVLRWTCLFGVKRRFCLLLDRQVTSVNGSIKGLLLIHLVISISICLSRVYDSVILECILVRLGRVAEKAVDIDWFELLSMLISLWLGWT